MLANISSSPISVYAQGDTTAVRDAITEVQSAVNSILDALDYLDETPEE